MTPMAMGCATATTRVPDFRIRLTAMAMGWQMGATFARTTILTIPMATACAMATMRALDFPI